MGARDDVGWVQLPGIRKVHYVRRHKALCGRYAYWGRLYDRLRYGRESKCRKCLEALEAMLRKEVYAVAEDAWLEEFDWKKRAGGDS